MGFWEGAMFHDCGGLPTSHCCDHGGDPSLQRVCLHALYRKVVTSPLCCLICTTVASSHGQGTSTPHTYAEHTQCTSTQYHTSTLLVCLAHAIAGYRELCQRLRHPDLYVHLPPDGPQIGGYRIPEHHHAAGVEGGGGSKPRRGGGCAASASHLLQSGPARLVATPPPTTEACCT